MANRVTQVYIETVVTGSPHVRATQIYTETVVTGSPHVRATQIYTETVVPKTPQNPASAQKQFFEFTQPT